MSFAADLQKFATKTGIRFDQVVRKVCLDMTKEIVQLTPVDTGMARSNYFFGMDRVTTVSNDYKAEAARSALADLGGSYGAGPMTLKEHKAVRTIKGLTNAKTMKSAMSRIQGYTAGQGSGNESIKRAATFASTLKAGGVFYITNNLPYIMRLEFGYSKQAPAGMARITVDRFQTIVNRVVGSL